MFSFPFSVILQDLIVGDAVIQNPFAWNVVSSTRSVSLLKSMLHLSFYPLK